MRIRLPFLFILTFWSEFVSGQISAGQDPQQIFLHHIEPMGWVIIQPIEPGMTLYSLSKRYNVSLDTILSCNTEMDPQAIPLGFPLNIPIQAAAISRSLPGTNEAAFPVFYRVQPKETLYRISKVYLGISPDSLIALNPRSSTNLSIGEVLHLGWYRPGEANVPSGNDEITSSTDTVAYKIKDYTKAYKQEGKPILEQKGLAVWKPGNDKTHYFVLHPTAAIGSYMEITNPMLHRTLTAKVAGNIPPGLYQSHVGLVVSPSVARALGVLDQQFFARWRYVE